MPNRSDVPEVEVAAVADEHSNLLGREHVTIKQSGTVPVVSHVPAWVWRCNECGWLGTGHTSQSACIRDVSDHVWTDHGIALCGSIDGERQWGHPGHRWKLVKVTDPISRCERCKETTGK